MPYLRCLKENEVDYTLHEVHKGVCENYLGVGTIAYKLLKKKIL